MTLLDNMYRDGTLISAETFLDDLRKLNYNTSRVKDYFDALQSTRYHETFPVSGTYQKVFNLLKGTYNPGTSSVEVYIDGSKIDSFEETSSNKITTTDNVQAGSVVDIYYKNIPSYSPDEINQLMDDYSNFKVAASEFNSTLQSVKDTWLSDTSVMISTKINDQLKAPLTELGNQIEAAKTESSQALEDLNNNIDSMRSTYNSTNDDMTTKFNALKDTLSKLDTDTTTIKSRIDEINKSLDKVDINMITSSILELESYQLLVPSDKNGDFTGKSDVTKFTIPTADKVTYTISAKVSGDDASKSSVVLYDKSDPSKISQQGSVPNSDSISSLTFVGDGSTLTVGVHSSGSQVSFSEMTGTKTDTYVPYRVAITNSLYAPLINNGVLYYNLANGIKVSSDLKDVAHTHSDNLLSLSTPVSSTIISGDYLITPDQLATISEVPSSERTNPGVLQVRTSGSYIYQTLITSINTRSRISIDKSSTWSQWRTIADDSKVVHTADMRKPAGDVAGIDEVSTLQTQVDNSSVGTNLITNLSSNWAQGWIISSTIGIPPTFKGDNNLRIRTLQTIPVSSNSPYTISINDTLFKLSWLETDSNGNTICTAPWVTSANYAFTTTSTTTQLYIVVAYKTDAIINTSNLPKIKLEKGSVATDWSPNPSDILTKADDSKVAHLSGANNFDTIPTVKNNPLLLASSLPSDLARTGQANTFSLSQTFSQGVKTLQTGSYDDANLLVNEGLYYNTNSSIKNGARYITTGYIQVMSGYGEIVRQIMYSDTDSGLIYDRTSQDGGSSWSDWIRMVTWNSIPSELAFTDRDTNFTAGLKSGGVDVATAADLKSLEASAWRQLDNKYIIPASGSTLGQATTILYKIDDSNHELYLSGSIALAGSHDDIDGVAVTVKLDSIVESILTSNVPYFGYYEDGISWLHLNKASKNSTSLKFITTGGLASIAAHVGEYGSLAYITYDKLV